MREIAEHVALRLKESVAVGGREDAQLATWRDQLAKRASAFEKMYDEKEECHVDFVYPAEIAAPHCHFSDKPRRQREL